MSKIRTVHKDVFLGLCAKALWIFLLVFPVPKFPL